MTESCGSVLLVDDDRQTRLKLTRILEAQGHTVTAVDCGPAALETLSTSSFELILLDILMPGMDGFQVLQTLKADNRLNAIPVIVISALDDAQSEKRCRQIGAQAYVKKPIDPDLLRIRIAECLKQE